MAFQLASRASLSLREVHAAARFGEQAIARAQEVGDTETEGGAHYYVGRAYTLIGDPVSAEFHLESFLALYPTSMERQAAKAHHDLAELYKRQRRWHEAIESLERAIHLYAEWNQMADHAKALLDLAWCYMLMGASSMAEPSLAMAESYLSREPQPELVADLLCAKAMWSRMEGDIQASCQFCQELFVTSRPGVTSRQIGEAAWIMGENALDLGRLEEAFLFGEWALDHATKANWPNLMNRILDLKRRIAERTTSGAEGGEH